MSTSVIRHRQVWHVVVSRKAPTPLLPVWLSRYDRLGKKSYRMLLCQVQNNHRFGWTVVVSGRVIGVRLVDGFKTQWQAIKYAISIREDLQPPSDR